MAKSNKPKSAKKRVKVEKLPASQGRLSKSEAERVKGGAEFSVNAQRIDPYKNVKAQPIDPYKN